MAGPDFMRRAAQEIFECALAAVDAREATKRTTRIERSPLTIAESTFPLPSIFEALGDEIITGPTGTNVRDLRIILAGN